MKLTTLNITINNVPEEDMAELWKQLADDFPLFKNAILPTNQMVIDYNVLKALNDDVLASLLGNAVACQIAMNIDATLNALQKINQQ